MAKKKKSLKTKKGQIPLAELERRRFDLAWEAVWKALSDRARKGK